LPSEIVSTTDFLKELEKRYAGLRYEVSMFKPFFAKDKRLFFDCRKNVEKNACLEKILARQDLEEFSILSIVKEEDKNTGKSIYTVNESKFIRIGREKPEDFINRYNKNLKEPMTLSMQLFGAQTLELIGFSYISPEERAELMKELRVKTG
jgi:hypothetical protein